MRVCQEFPRSSQAQLEEQAASYPLIDGIAGSILFPTIIRNVSTGQGEPLGFIFAVDEGYDTGFGLHEVGGEQVRNGRSAGGDRRCICRFGWTVGAIGRDCERNWTCAWVGRSGFGRDSPGGWRGRGRVCFKTKVLVSRCGSWRFRWRRCATWASPATYLTR